MGFIVAGLASAVFAYLTNRFAYRVWGNAVLIGPVPLVEEVAKTMLAWGLGASILFTHLAFGVTEALLDWHGDGKGVAPALCALAAHSVFGLVTMIAVRETGSLGIGITSAFLIHAVWNTAMLFRTVKR